MPLRVRIPAHRPLVAIAVTAATALSLTACSGEAAETAATPSPSPTARTTPSPTATASPTPSVPTLPPEAEGKGKAAAEAFARYYIDTVSLALTSFETDRMVELASTECFDCNAIAETLERIESDGGDYRGGEWTISTVKMRSLSAGRFEALVAVDVQPHEVKVSDSDEYTQYKGGSELKVLQLQRNSGAWRVERLDQPDL